jgi:hypothetical protein
MPRRGIDGEFGATMKTSAQVRDQGGRSFPFRSETFTAQSALGRGQELEPAHWFVELRENLCRAQTSAWRSDRRRFPSDDGLQCTPGSPLLARRSPVPSADFVKSHVRI